MVDLRHEESVLICFLHWLGTSTFRKRCTAFECFASK
jgi:hypothetical protein